MAGWLGRGVNASQIAEDMDDNSSLHSTGQLTHEEVQARIDDVERKQKQVEAALQGCGSYLGINDHVSASEESEKAQTSLHLDLL